MGHAMRAFRLNLKRWAEDHPVVVGVILASGTFFGLLALAHGCETKVKAEGFHRRDAESAENKMGGCTDRTRGGRAESAREGIVAPEPSRVPPQEACGIAEPVRTPAQPPIFLKAVAVPLREGPLAVPGGAARGVSPSQVAEFAGLDISMGGCGKYAERAEIITADPGGLPRRCAAAKCGEHKSGQPPISLQAVAVPLVEGPREAPAGQPAIPPVGPGGRRFRVTAYCPCEKCCGRWADDITASGTRADHRLVAAPREFPFGTEMRIPGYGTVRVEDRGGAIRGDRLDVLFPTHAEALVWGVRWMDVEVWKP